MPPSQDKPPSVPDDVILDSLRRNGLLQDSDKATFTALTGGVSSDIWKVDADGRVYCVKRALPKLKVEADWFAPIERNRYEAEWCEIANGISPSSAPTILARDEEAMLCAMEYLDPNSHRLWKSELKEGRVDLGMAAKTGAVLGRIHSGTASSGEIRQRFPRSDIFRAIRLEPYLEATAARHPDLESQLLSLSRATENNAITLIHGDVSPKNILVGPDGPVFLDAECACIGDPAFDIAFCLNHLLLKCLWNPAARTAFISGFKTMASSYLQQVDWEKAVDLESRAARLLPGLFLARVDGKSPVEYVDSRDQKDSVRRCARQLLADPQSRLEAVAEAWERELNRQK